MCIRDSTDIANTFVIDAATYGKQPMLFGNETEGNKLLTEWGLSLIHI